MYLQGVLIFTFAVLDRPSMLWDCEDGPYMRKEYRELVLLARSWRENKSFKLFCIRLESGQTVKGIALTNWVSQIWIWELIEGTSLQRVESISLRAKCFELFPQLHLVWNQNTGSIKAVHYQYDLDEKAEVLNCSTTFGARPHIA